MLRAFRSPLIDQLTAFTELRSRYAGSPLIAIQLAPANFHWLSDTALETFGELSATTGALIHMHLLESIYQSMYMQRRAGADRATNWLRPAKPSTVPNYARIANSLPASLQRCEPGSSSTMAARWPA
jgi:hypothetical protein